MKRLIRGPVIEQLTRRFLELLSQSVDLDGNYTANELCTTLLITAALVYSNSIDEDMDQAEAMLHIVDIATGLQKAMLDSKIWIPKDGDNGKSKPDPQAN